jgi:allophanate hydrolase
MSLTANDPGILRMLPSLDFAALHGAYRAGGLSPISVVAEITARLRAQGDDGVWISRFAGDALAAEAADLERRAAMEGLDAMPLYGLPFAVKDNIDVAGLPTTCACPEFSHAPARSAPVVERLRRAGAICIGKTNLDQFATGLVGVRSPYGVPRNPFDASYIPGGSSSGSAVAVAAGLVAFALGTDTAGSGRVPASFNNIVGLKPTRGLISTGGVVPACRSLDCVSIFALTVTDAACVLDVARGVDSADGRSRSAPPGFRAMGRLPERFTFGVVGSSDLEFFGNADGRTVYAATIDRLTAIGGQAVTIDYAPFLEATRLIYRGPWLNERHGAIAAAMGDRWDALLPTVRGIVAAGGAISGTEVYAGFDRLAALRQDTREVWGRIDLLMLPTTGTIYRLAEIDEDPIALNENLGRYTNFCNLLDLSAIAVPAGFRSAGLPSGVTLFAPAFHDPLLAAIGSALQAAAGLPLGATGRPYPTAPKPANLSAHPFVPILVLGAHLSGQPLNHELVALGARLRRTVRTAPEYGLYALADGKRPGLVCHASGGAAIEGEVWDVPAEAIGALLATIAPPLGLGSVTLEDGSVVNGLLCEAYAVETARDITHFGGWRAAMAASV